MTPERTSMAWMSRTGGPSSALSISTEPSWRISTVPPAAQCWRRQSSIASRAAWSMKSTESSTVA